MTVTPGDRCTAISVPPPQLHVGIGQSGTTQKEQMLSALPRKLRDSGRSLLLLRNARRLAHRVPAPELARHVLAERLRGRAAHDHARGGPALLPRLLPEAFVDGPVQLGVAPSPRAPRPK